MKRSTKAAILLVALSITADPAISQRRSEGAYFDRLNHLAGTRGIDSIQARFNIFGEISATQATFMTVWDGPDDIRSLPLIALAMTAQSTDTEDATGLSGLESLAIDCLDINFDVIPRQVVAMNGTTPVAIPISCFRIQRIIGLDPNENGQTNLGDISIENSGTVYEFIPVGIGGSHSFAFTVPNETVLILNDAVITPGPDGVVPRFIIDSLGVVPQTITSSIDGTPHQFSLDTCMSEGADFTIQVKSGQGAVPVSVEVGVDAILVLKVGGQCP